MKTGYFRMLFTLLAVLLLGSAAKAQTIYYVTPTGANPTTGNKWEVSEITDKQILTLPEALAAANAGDQIWLLGFEQITTADQLYVAPADGFTVNSGIKLYGGFRGTERTIDERPTLGKAPYFTYRSVLSGDIKRDDKVDEINYVYPTNTTRSDNAAHVLSLNMKPTEISGNNNTYPTVVNGFTVIGGNAIGGNGGGIYVYGNNTGGGAYQIEKCFLLNNYAAQGGGAIYVASDVKATSTESRIVDCVVYNNLAGQRSGTDNLGGGIRIDGAGTIVNSSIFNNEGGGVLLSANAKAVNLTIARNTVMGIEGGVVSNSVIWGNSKVQNPTATSFENCASDNATIAGNKTCISISSESNGANGPLFEAPSVFTSFDRDFDWRRTAYPTWSWGILEGSALIDEGDDDAYTGLPSADLAGETRKKGTIDIGAYEFQHLDAGRIRYVKVGGTGDGSSWDKASGDLQKMIDELAAVDAPGEVWVAAGTYRPTTQIIEGVQYAASFRMRDGIDVYGGFAGTETSKAARKKGSMPWIYSKETVLLGADYDDKSAEWIENSSQWNVISSSRHVVWFAPMSGEDGFKYATVLDGVTIKGGAANGGEGVDNFATDKGGGVYMELNATLQNCVVTENTAKDNGGGVYVKNGRVIGCLIYNNSAVENGGGVFVENAGLVLRSMITDNSATNGAGVYLDKNNSTDAFHPEYLILSTSVVSNNTATGNGAVYCNESGVLLQNTIVNNDCPSTVDASNPNSSQTGGLYINKYAYVINSILWNNRIGAEKEKAINVPMYALGATADKVRFYNNAISGSSMAVWNNIYQTSTLKLSDDNASAAAIGPDFMGGYPTGVGVQGSLDRPSYYWEPKQGSNLRAGGLTIGTFPSIVLVSPELDIAGIPFAQKPAMGAHGVKANKISASNYEVFVDINYTGTDANGASWATPYKSLNEVLAYFANDPKLNLTKETVVRVHVKEGDYWPRYAFTNLDPKTATLSIPALPNGATFEIYGGYAAESGNKEGEDDDKNLDLRFPTIYRTIINGNHEGKNIDEGIYHCITVETGANVVLDGFHVINGYAAGTATLRYGAGMLVRDGATVEVRNSIFENNTAEEAAAIDARGATLSLINCVVNNNTNTNTAKAVVNANANALTVNHVSVVNNVGAGLGAGNNSFAAGNSSNNSHSFTVDTNTFVNPTKKPGATLGFDTYLGGYSSFMPTGMNPVVNEGKNSDEQFDITFGTRSLGGAPDLGAYEAELPVDGTVIYVRGTDGKDSNDGLAWNRAKKTIAGAFKAVSDKTKEIWVAGGEYTERLTMVEGVNVLGGFAATGNPNNELDGVNRDISNSNPDFMTIIDGQNGGRVLTQPSGFSDLTTWEGLVIQNGNVTSSSASENGGGVRILNNGIVKNCLIQNNTFNRTGDSDAETRGGGGVYAGAGARIENCIIKGNMSRHQYDDRDWLPDYEVGNVLGGGAFIDGGTLINSIIIENKAENFHNDKWGLPEYERNGNILGAAAYVSKESKFYNCTFAYNYANSRGGAAAAGGVWDKSTNGSTFYNCVIWGNYANGNTGENTFQLSTPGYSQGGGVNTKIVNCYISATSDSHVGGTVIWNNEDLCAQINVSTNNGYGFYTACRNSAPFDNNTFKLKNEGNGLHCINKGDNESVAGIFLDALGADRIQDCTVDKGAYEYTGSTVATDINEFYVTPNGSGTADGSSADNAACEMMLQKVLDQAGKRVAAGEKGVVVKIAAKIDENGVAREYNANTLSDPNDPQSYTFKVPAGVTVEGGYDNNFTVSKRFEQETKLSPVANSRGQTVNGYHAVTFGEPAEGQSGLQTIIDGVTLTGGKATSMVGSGENTQGGGAIVPAWGHIRNCRVSENEAIQGGGLYLLPGALVSGTVVNKNTAEEGAGIYASVPQPTEEGEIPTVEPAHVVSSTVTDNEATDNGGGIYFADGGALFLNMVVWGNTATSDNNVSGSVYSTFSDSKMEAASAANGNNFTEFYPFNYSFVERFELPSNMVNTAMTSDEDLYFAGPERTLRAFSPLVKQGYSTKLQDHLVTNWGIAENDMQGIERKQNNINKIDVGAYAFMGGVIPDPTDPETEKLTKLFVNQTTKFRVDGDENYLKTVVGRSFYTPLYHLDDALEYVRKAREAGFNDEIEIFVAQGTYKPTIRRTDAAAATETYDQRQNSFVVPAGVKIYGGFIGEEIYSTIASVKGESGELTLKPDFNTETALSGRATTDFNQNGISEPWELTNQTILSGQVNASETAKNAYHVLFSNTTEYSSGTVTLDGLTVMDGETASTLSPMGDDNEVGRGGGLYSSGVDYILNRCRFLNNKGIRGNAAYVRNATATVIGSIFAGNSTVETSKTAAGGALCLAADKGETAALKAVNTLWANNETTGNGGAIGYAVNGSGSTSVNLMNNTIVRNKALNNGAIYAQGGTVTNTLVWGNEGEGDNMSGVTATYSAAEDLDATNGNNIKLAAANTSIDGPRFAQPSEAAGAAANDPMTKWNPSSINVLTDAGNGVLAAGKDIDAIGEATGAYKDWWTDNENSNWTNAVAYYATKFMRTDDGGQYYRYAGPRDEKGEQLDRTIDIGLYEYQYVTTFSKLDAVYVATTEAGNGSGDSWLNATSDLRGAIISMANPTGGQTSDKAVYIRDGEYASKQLLTGTAFPLNMDKDADDGMNGSSLTIKGSFNEAGQQDFSNPTVISSYSGLATQRLMNITTNGEPVFIEGITFNNATANGDGIVSTGDNLTLGNVAFRGNAGTGVVLGTQGENPLAGNALIYNTLFADGGTGLDIVNGGATVVNATFANNGTAINGTASVYNSVSWKSGDGVATDEINRNAALGDADNDDIQNGPNFVDPENGDYRIRPSMTLLNMGDNRLYQSNVGIDPKTDVDLTSGKRVVDDIIDIGAYEYAAPLSQILYVKSGVVGSDESGASWTNAISDLQGAINLASIYVNNSPEEDTGYVFVHNNVSAGDVRVAMPGVKAYGSMNDETGTDVTDILGKRSSILDLQRRSTINGLTVAGTGSVVDGFEVSGTVAVSDGMLSTSIVKPTDPVSVTENGVLYNSFVEGAVNKPETVNGKAVNVTATGAINVSDDINNNPNATENGYVSVDYWKYQLKDDSGLFDKAEEETITAYMEMAGHSKDLSGSIRVRNGLVDFGCFETWNITANTEISATDKPTRNHVVYVREGNELSIDGDALVYTGEATAFNPGFLLLENGSGLLANGNHVGLTNFAMERTIPAEGTALTYVPFLIDKMDNASGATFQRYDGATRAAYNYQFGDGDAWGVDIDPATAQGGVQAFAINGSADAKVRFYGTSYKETPNEDKMVQLMKFNFNDPWTTENPGTGKRFTHKENMSWNMFGSPYLHAMNYKDMEYGRVIYTGVSYTAINTAENTGFVAMGEGVFTQSATLQDYETFTVAAPTAGSDPQGLRGLLVTVAPADAEEADDFIQVKAVESEEASSEFNIAADGVKWMSDNASVAQIYMARNGGRYSMLSALDINGAVSLGLTIPEAAAYTIAIDEEAWMDEYETVVLEDKTTGQMVDLLEGAYQFQATEAGTVEDRFSIRFNRIVDGLGDNVKAYSPSAGMIRVEGAAAGSLVRIYDLNGRCIRVGETSVVNYDVNVGPKGIYLVEVQQKEAEPVVKKVQVK